MGRSAPAVSVTRKDRCSGVCPGVCIASIRMLPTMKVSPSCSRTAPSSAANAYRQSAPPSSERYSRAPVAAASSRAPETKSAWMCVSVTWVMRSPSASAAAT